MLYQKIEAPFERDLTTNKLTRTFKSAAVEALYNVPVWHVTEKIDGTNVRVLWDGYEVTFGGRTERAELPKPLLAHLEAAFRQEQFEETFGGKPVVLFGEGYGPKIQNGGKYRDDVDFALFDVAVNGNYLRPADTENVAESWGISHVPVVSRGFMLSQIVWMVQQGSFSSSAYGDFAPEGVVAKTAPGLLDHRGQRLIVKVKGVDFA